MLHIQHIYIYIYIYGIILLRLAFGIGAAPSDPLRWMMQKSTRPSE